MNNKLVLFLILMGTALISCKTNKIDGSIPQVKLDKFKKVEKLIKKMTLDEKIGQMNLYSSFYDVTGPVPKDGSSKDKYEHLKNGLVGGMLNVNGVENVRKLQEVVVNESRLGIPLIFGFDVIHGHKTQFPIPMGEAASFDLDVIEKGAQIAAKEAAAMGLNWTFAPMVDISRDPRWGRVMEGAGEDTYYGSVVAATRVKGFQGDDLADPLTIAACTKHFAAYGFAESGKDYNTTDIGTATLYNTVLPPFKATVDAGVATFMNGFNDLNGTPVTSSAFLQRDILKGRWGFDGFVVSDWGSIGEIIKHGQVETLAEAALQSANAGSDMDMESYAYIGHLKSKVESGEVSMEVIDEAVRRILNVKYKLGLFDDPYKYCNKERQDEMIFHPDHLAAAKDAAMKSCVLLKNEGGILPLNRTNKKIAVIGPMVEDRNSPLGSWRLAAEDNSAVTLREGLEKYNGINWSFHKGVHLAGFGTSFVFETKVNETDRTGMDDAVEAAKSADMVILAVGEKGYMSGEARSRSKLGLPGLQQELLEKIYAVNQNIVLVLYNGRPLTIPWAAENVPAILEVWQPGSEGGNAIAEILMGDYNPSGKLPMTFPRSVGQIPIYYNPKSSGRGIQQDNPDIVFWSHYNDEKQTPQFAFGHGLSYTTFKYDNLKAIVNEDGTVDVSVKVTNTGGYDGEEVVQLYIRDLYCIMTRPIKELKGFEKIMLKSGEHKTVSFKLTDKELGWFDADGEWFVEKGTYDIMVGGASDVTIKTRIDTRK